MSELEALKKAIETFLFKIYLSPDLCCLAEADEGEQGDLIDAVVKVRKIIADDLGFVFGSVHIMDNLDLAESTYQILLDDTVLCNGSVEPDKLLVLLGEDLDRECLPFDLKIVKEPVFGIDAAWIEEDDARYYEDMGCNVVSAGTVLHTHLYEVCKANAHLLFRMESLLALLEVERECSDRLIDYLIPDKITVERLHALLCRLLKEKMSLKPFSLVLESIAHYEDQDDPKPDVEIFMKDRLKAFNDDMTVIS